MNKYLIALLGIATLSNCAASYIKDIPPKATPPNVILIFTDDQGYQDLGCYASPDIRTPELDAMAQEGVRFTDFYVTASVCSPSRASLLTGRYSFRNGVTGVYFPDTKGIRESEISIATLLKPVGYRTACVGKWHLGDRAGSMPLDQGFDYYYGIPYSNDMYIGANQTFADEAVFREGYTLADAKADQDFVKYHDRSGIKESGRRDKVPLFENTAIIEYPCDQSTLTTRYFQQAINFIQEDTRQPFFLYLAPTMPHVPLFASSQFTGQSEGGTYGDVIEEIDWNVGQLLDFLEQQDLAKNTMIIFASDNGPWLSFKAAAGHADPLREGKFSAYEGGFRVPCIMRWPGKWASGHTSSALASTLDLLPTIAHYAGAPLPDCVLDGYNIASHLEDPTTATGREQLLYTRKEEIVGIRWKDWKYLPHGGDRYADESYPPELYNLANDIGEAHNLATQARGQLTVLQQKLDQAVTAAGETRFNLWDPVPGRWSTERINAWYQEQPWLVGCNYYPATAINQIDMWQASTWDLATIRKELGWAADMGMNTLRVFLHDMVWGDDESGLYQRMDEFLAACEAYNIRPWFVFFDDCHYPEPQLGVQPLPVKSFHNSAWLNCPARGLARRYANGEATPAEQAHLRGYVQRTIARFKDDPRVLMWELYNEPGRGNSPTGKSADAPPMGELSNQLVFDAWRWARAVAPSQPITATTAGSVGKNNIRINQINSDLYAIHSYGSAEALRAKIQNYQQYGRPVIVSEWLARTAGSTVQACLPVMKEMDAGAVNWGFVAGETGTIWPWSSRLYAKGNPKNLNQLRASGEVFQQGEAFPEPALWFHDLLRPDGTPYREEEIQLFKTLTARQ